MTTEPIVEQGPVGGPVDGVTDEQLVAMLVDRARGDGLKLTGEGGLFAAVDQAGPGVRVGR